MNFEKVPSTLLLTEEDVRKVYQDDLSVALRIVEESFHKRMENDVLMPDKISQIFDEATQDRINCMPATLVSDKMCGVKWISVFPGNPLEGLPNITGTIILSEIRHGFPVSILGASYLTGVRTAAIGATAAKYLSRPDAESIGFIGAGKEARQHLDMVKIARPGLKVCYVSSRRESTVESFIAEEQKKHPDLQFVPCGNDFEKATKDADIIVTATSSQLQLLKASYVKKGAFYIHVGGFEDEYAVPRKASKIVCDEWNSIKHRTQTISRMFKEGLLKDEDIYSDLGDIIAGRKAGRENDEEFIYFCSVGLPFIDVMFAKYTYEKARELKLGTEFNF